MSGSAVLRDFARRIEELERRLEALEKGRPQHRKPGRPKKYPEAEKPA